MTESDAKVSVEKAVQGLQKILEDLAPDLDAQRASWIGFAASFFRTCAPIARENKSAEYARALDLVAEMGMDLVQDFYPKGKK